MCDVADDGLFGSRGVGKRFHPGGEHGVAEGAAHGDFFGTSGKCFGGAVFVDTGAEFFFHEHTCAARAAAEAFVAVAVHFAQFHAGGTEEFARRVENFVVSPEEAGIMVGDGFACRRRAGHGFQQTVTHQPVEELGVVENIEMSVEVGVFVAQGVEAVRAGGDDFALACGNAVENPVEGGDVFFGEHLEKEFVSGAACGVAGAGFAFGEHAVFHACGFQQFDDGAGGFLALVVEGSSAADPEQVFGVGEAGDVLTKDRYGEAVAAGFINPGDAFRVIAAPRVAFRLQVFEHASELGGEVGFGENLEASQVGHVVDVFNIHGALFDAGPAVGAAPKFVASDGCTHEFQHVHAVVHGAGIIKCGVADISNELFGAERLVGVPGGALFLAAAAFGAGRGVEKHGPRHILGGANPDCLI